MRSSGIVAQPGTVGSVRGVTTCDRCGVVDDGEGGALGWSSASTGRGVRWFCAACTREHVRDIEAKLDEEWWS
jgi:hypothetical protein